MVCVVLQMLSQPQPELQVAMAMWDLEKHRGLAHLLLLALRGQNLGDPNAVEHDMDSLLKGVGDLSITLLKVPFLRTNRAKLVLMAENDRVVCKLVGLEIHCSR